MENEEIIKRYCGNTIMAVELTDRQLIIHFAGETGFAITNQTGGMSHMDELHELAGQSFDYIGGEDGYLLVSDEGLVEVWQLKLVTDEVQAMVICTNEGAGWDGGFDLVVSEVR